MRILMLGWEFPPFIAGGLGVACHGLTRSLDRLGHEITFILPRPVDQGEGTHVRLVAPSKPQAGAGESGESSPRPGVAGEGSGSRLGSGTMSGTGTGAVRASAGPSGGPIELAAPSEFQRATFISAPATFTNPYTASEPVGEGGAWAGPASSGPGAQRDVGGAGGGDGGQGGSWGDGGGGGAAGGAGEAWTGGAPDQHEPYGKDLIGDAERYARMVVSMAGQLEFDVIHAHDWLTYPAGLALSRVTGKPLVAHVHATEFDRSGEHVNQQVYEIERRGLHGCTRAIAVSMLTKSICAYRYGAPPDKVDVIYNGIEEEGAQPTEEDMIRSGDRIVLFLGRITMQKGPEYFIGAAKRVLEKLPNVKFVVAGSGDMAIRMIEMAAQLGIGHRVLFTGFLHREDVLRVYRMADCYVMPSVSEPFGLVALEAIQNDVPAIISKQSGAAEVLTHVLKVDFWDVDEIANKIVAVLRHPPLGATLRQHGPLELRRLTWDGAAERVIQTYVAAGLPAPNGASGRGGLGKRGA